MAKVTLFNDIPVLIYRLSSGIQLKVSIEGMAQAELANGKKIIFDDGYGYAINHNQRVVVYYKALKKELEQELKKLKVSDFEVKTLLRELETDFSQFKKFHKKGVQYEIR